ncbi:MAG: GlsB/YeaQ/YmgE family stress response membrane protein [Chloroflexota bacterium]
MPLLILAIVALLLLIWSAFAVTALVFHLIPWIIVGLIAGALASAIVGSRHGLLGDIVLGMFGSIVGGFIFGTLLHVRANILTDILMATGGAVIVLLIGKVVGKRPRYA